MKNHTVQEYTGYDQACEHFNRHLFDSKLPPFLITLQHKRHAHGYFAPKQFTSRTNGAEKTDEIALNPDTFIGLTDKDILSILVHEMVHLWQAHFGQQGRRGYHNRAWAQKMVDVGLQPVSLDAPGKMTGQAVTHMIVPGGRFDVAAEHLLATGFRLNWQSIAESDDVLQGEDGPHLTRVSKVKYTCPQCGQNAWAKPQSRLLCGQCIETYVENAVQPSTPSTLSTLLRQFAMRPLLFPKPIGRREKERSGKQQADLATKPTAWPVTDQPGDYTTTDKTVFVTEPPTIIIRKTVTGEEGAKSPIDLTPRPASTALTPTGGFLEGFTHTLNPYVGCRFACAYCYVQGSPVHRFHKPFLPWGDYAHPRTDIADHLEHELARFAKKGELDQVSIFMSSATDPYQGLERRWRLTRACLEVMVKYPPGLLNVQTRSPFVQEDYALLRQLGQRCWLNFTVETDLESVRQAITPRCPAIAKRLAALDAALDMQSQCPDRRQSLSTLLQRRNIRQSAPQSQSARDRGQLYQW